MANLFCGEVFKFRRVKKFVVVEDVVTRGRRVRKTIDNLRISWPAASRQPASPHNTKVLILTSNYLAHLSGLMCSMIPTYHIKNRLIAQMYMTPSQKTSEPSGKHGLDLSSLREAVPFWFAISSPLTGLLLGFLGAWLVTWLTS